MNFPHVKGLPPSVALLSTALCNAPAFAADPIRAMTADSIEFKADANVQGVAMGITLTEKK
jgi:hypothetical protein